MAGKCPWLILILTWGHITSVGSVLDSVLLCQLISVLADSVYVYWLILRHWNVLETPGGECLTRNRLPPERGWRNGTACCVPSCHTCHVLSFFFSTKCQKAPKRCESVEGSTRSIWLHLIFSTCVSQARCLLHVVKVCTIRVEEGFFSFLEVDSVCFFLAACNLLRGRHHIFVWFLFSLRLDLCRHMLSPIRSPGCERSFHRKNVEPTEASREDVEMGNDEDVRS